MASAPLTKEIAEALERVTATGNRRNRTSREWAESEMEYCAALAGLRALFGYGDWLPFVKERGWPYDDVSRCLRFHKLGGTPELLQEHRMTGSLALLSEQHRAARREAAPTPEPGPDPASEEDDQFCNSAKFDPPPETPPGAGDAPAPEEDEGGGGAASEEFASAPGTAPQQLAAEPAPESPVEGEGDADAIQAAWQTVRERLPGEVGEGHFKSWIKPCRIEARGAGAALLAPTRFMRDRVRGTYGERIQQLWHRELPGIELVFEVGNAVPEPQQRLPLSGGHAAATAGNVTLAVSPKTAQGNAPALRFAAVAAAAADVRMRRTTRLFMVNLGWRYWPGRPWRGDVEELGALTGLKRTAAYEAFQEALHYGHLHSDSPPGSRQRTAWWPVVEIAAETGWEPPEQYELNFRQTLDRKAADYLSSFSGVVAYG